MARRWLIIHSEAAEGRAHKSTQRRLLKLTEKESKAFEKLCRQPLACEQDAYRALEAFQKKLKALTVEEAHVSEVSHYATGRRPRQGSAPIDQFQADLARASLFILATNETDSKALSDEEVLTTYKAQPLSERGFKFLKDPMFFAATLFLKKVERVMALLRVMTVCLLVYAALEHRIRTVLGAHHTPVRIRKASPLTGPLPGGSLSFSWMCIFCRSSTAPRRF